jgi:acyl-coenzyme A thioesterase PaaI-like protein
MFVGLDIASKTLKDNGLLVTSSPDLASKRRMKMSGTPLILPANRCFACGPENPIGLHIEFTLEDGLCTGLFTPGENHVGFPDTVHGGIIFSALDDVMANNLYLRGIRAHTARCEIRYRRNLRVGEQIRLTSKVDKERKSLVILNAEARTVQGDAMVADCRASFMRE